MGHSFGTIFQRGSMFREIILPTAIICLLAISGYMVVLTERKVPEFPSEHPERWCSPDSVSHWVFRGPGYLDVTVRVDTLGRVYRCTPDGTDSVIVRAPAAPAKNKWGPK